MPDTERPPRDLLAFRGAAQRYLAMKGRRGDEDLLSAMVVEALEHPTTALDMNVTYLRALDICDPRHTVRGQRQRDSQRTMSLDAQMPGADDGVHTTIPPASTLPSISDGSIALPQRGPERAILLLHTVYGYTQAEIGIMFGVTESRISQIVHDPRTMPCVDHGPRRSARQATLHGITQTLAAWCRASGLNQRTFYGRIARGWSLERTMTEPCHAHNMPTETETSTTAS